MAYKNRVRLPIFFSKPQFPTERNVFRLANGETKVQSVVVRNTYEGKTDQLPESWHRKLVVALAHDTVSIESERLLSNVVMNEDYDISWQDFLNCPIAAAGFKVEVTPFNATNSNCQTCEEMSQVVLVDDTTDEIWDEGTTHVFPDVLTDNDSICCHPYTVSMVYYNTLYFSACSISAGGVLTATVFNPSPDLNGVLIARYRVTCADGSYDDADVYGNISGSQVNFCAPVIGAVAYIINSTTADVSWDVALPAPVQWLWTLYLTSDLGTPLQSGTVLIPDVIITGLTSGLNYTVKIIADCGGGDLSAAVLVEFIINEFAPGSCGSFTITYLPTTDISQSCSYMDCDGVIINVPLTYAQELTRCMLIVGAATEPIYFVASSVDVTVNYIELC